MDRRGFFKTMLATPLLTPLLLASKTTQGNCELYLIADSPQLFISFILEELQKYGISTGRNFTLLNSHPQENELRQILSQKGWQYIQNPSMADIAISFSSLRQDAIPSFTLVRKGEIWDIRSKKLYSLWKEMNENRNPSSCLTIASLKDKPARLFPGESVSIFKDGHRIETVSLKESQSKSFSARKGKITVVVKDRKAWIGESSCSHKICLYTPPVSFAGERIICAPNHFLLEVQGRHSIDTVIG